MPTREQVFSVGRDDFSEEQLSKLALFLVQHRTPLTFLQLDRLLERIERFESVGHFVQAPGDWQAATAKLERMKPVLEAARAYERAIEAWISAEAKVLERRIAS